MSLELGVPQTADAVPCCPQLETEDRCDFLTYDYRLRYPVRDVVVEVILRARLERCPGPLALGDLVHSTTLLPGEKVRLFTANRRSRFTFDRESEVSYRHEQTSEETFYMSSMDRFLSDLTVREEGGSQSTSQGSYHTDGSVSGAIETFFDGPSVHASGSHNAQSTFDFARELTQHAEASHSRSVEATRAASSVSVGEVQSRSHAEGESESSFEASSRTFSNPNRCHAVTYFFYQINKTQIVRFSIESIRRRVIDPAGSTEVTSRKPQLAGQVAVIPQGVLATADNRLKVEAAGRSSVLADRLGTVTQADSGVSGASFATASPRLLLAQPVAGVVFHAQPLSSKAHAQALQAVDEELVATGVIDQVGGDLTAELKAELSFEIRTSLPTPAMLVKGCLDPCCVCEPELKRTIELDLENQKLQNDLLRRQIQLLEKSQEYRCCPVGEAEDEDA